MALTAEEVEKLKELKRTEEFKKNYKLIKDELVKETGKVQTWLPRD